MNFSLTNKKKKKALNKDFVWISHFDFGSKKDAAFGFWASCGKLNLFPRKQRRKGNVRKRELGFQKIKKWNFPGNFNSAGKGYIRRSSEMARSVNV